MSGPWEDYKTESAPWEDYGTPQPQMVASHTPGKRILDDKSTRKTVSDFIRPMLEGGGAVAGGLAGVPAAPATFGLSSLGGAGLGYAAGSRLADLIEGKPRTLSDAMLQSANDIENGAILEMGGQIVGRLGGAAINAYKNQKATGAPYSRKSAATTAGRKLSDVYTADIPIPVTSFLDTPIGTQRIVQPDAKSALAERLQRELGIELTPAQQTGDFKAALFEQGLASRNPDLASALATREAQAQQKAIDLIRQAIGQGEALPTAATSQEIGQTARNSLQSAKTAVRNVEKPLWDAVPDYPMPFNTLDATSKALVKDPLSMETATRATNMISQMPKTVRGMQAVDRWLGGELKAASRAGKDNDARVFKTIRDSITKDFESLSQAAESGDIALLNGQIVRPSQLNLQRQQMVDRIAQTEASLKPNMDAVRQELQTAGVHPSNYSKLDPSDNAWEQRAITAYQKQFGKTPPTIGNIDDIARYQEGIARIDQDLASLQPAEDVANIYKTAKDFSKTQYFDKFRRGTVDKIMAKGNETNGFRMSDDAISRQIFTPKGSKDILNALGKDQSSNIMRDHVVNELAKQKTVPKMMQFIQQNRTTLNNLGLFEEAKTLAKKQLPIELENILATKRVSSITDEPYLTLNEAQKLLNSHASAIKQLYGPDAVSTLRNYYDMMKVFARNKNVTYGGGSNTAEKLAFGQQAQKLGIDIAVSKVPGGTIARGIQKIVNEGYENEVNQLLKDAMLNPSNARKLINIAKQVDAEKAYRALKELVSPFIKGAGIGAGMQLTRTKEVNQ